MGVQVEYVVVALWLRCVKLNYWRRMRPSKTKNSGLEQVSKQLVDLVLSKMQRKDQKTEGRTQTSMTNMFILLWYRYYVITNALATAQNHLWSPPFPNHLWQEVVKELLLLSLSLNREVEIHAEMVLILRTKAGSVMTISTNPLFAVEIRQIATHRLTKYR